MKRLFAALALIAAPALAEPSPVAVKTVASLPAYKTSAPVTGTIRLWGHGSFKRDFMGKLVNRWIAEFQRNQPGVQFKYEMYGTASAIGALYTDSGDIALLGEEISPDADRAFRRVRGYAPTKIEVANGSLETNFFDYAHMVFVHRDNPLVGMDMRQLEAVFGAEHRCTKRNIRNWGELGLKGDWANKPITPYGWETDVDFGLFIRERVMCDSHRWNPAIKEFAHATRPDGSQYDHGQRIVDALAKDRYGIAISNLRYATPEVRALPLAWKPGGKAVAPSDASLIDRSYPLVRIIPAYIDHKPGTQVTPAVREFLRYVISREGQAALIEESGYLPLSAATAAHERGLLK